MPNAKAKGGTGLGLAIAKQIVEIARRSHLGRIDEDGGERRSQLVAHVGDELRLVLARDL